MPQPSAHPHRTLFSTMIGESDLGAWQALGVEAELPPEGGKFVGIITEATPNQGKLGLINGDNTSQKAVGFANVSINPVYTQENIHNRAANPDYTYPAGMEVFVIRDKTALFRLKVGTGTATIDELKPGQTYQLKVEGGEQVLDPDNTDGPVVIFDNITEASRGFVHVQLAG